MTDRRRIDRPTARRFLMLRHLLAPPRALPAEPASVLRVVDRLGSLQFDPLEVAGRNHDLVLLSRIDGYRRAWTDALLYEDRALFEAYNKGLSLLPTTELPYHRLTWDRNRTRHEAGTFVEHAELVEELLDRIRRDGPLSSTDVEPRAAIDWYWRPTNQVRAILEALAEAGVLGLARREGNRRVYDLAERLFEPTVLAERPTAVEQRRHRLLSRYRANGLLGRSGSAELWMGTAPGVRRPATPPDMPTRGELLAELLEAGALVPVEVDGIRGERFIVADEVDVLDAAERAVREEGLDRADDAAWAVGTPGGCPPGVAFLAPLDPLVWDRDLLRRLFAFDYVWEVYVPAAKRRWGYYVLPVLYGDRLVGRIEPRIDRRAGALRVAGLWWEEGFDPLAAPGFADASAAALQAHAAFGGVARVTLPRTVRHRGLTAALRERLPAGRPVRS